MPPECHPWMTAKDQQWDLVASGTEVQVCNKKKHTKHWRSPRPSFKTNSTDPKSQLTKSSKYWFQNKVLEDSREAISVAWREPPRKLLVGFEVTVVALHRPKNISELGAPAHQKRAKIAQEHYQRLVSGYASCPLQVVKDALSSKDTWHEGGE